MPDRGGSPRPRRSQDQRAIVRSIGCAGTRGPQPRVGRRTDGKRVAWRRREPGDGYPTRQAAAPGLRRSCRRSALHRRAAAARLPPDSPAGAARNRASNGLPFCGASNARWLPAALALALLAVAAVLWWAGHTSVARAPRPATAAPAGLRRTRRKRASNAGCRRPIGCTCRRVQSGTERRNRNNSRELLVDRGARARSRLCAGAGVPRGHARGRRRAGLCRSGGRARSSGARRDPSARPEPGVGRCARKSRLDQRRTRQLDRCRAATTSAALAADSNIYSIAACIRWSCSGPRDTSGKRSAELKESYAVDTRRRVHDP